MARIPEADIERLKNEVSLVRLIESQGHTLTKRGRDWVMRCAGARGQIRQTDIHELSCMVDVSCSGSIWPISIY